MKGFSFRYLSVPSYWSERQAPSGVWSCVWCCQQNKDKLSPSVQSRCSKNSTEQAASQPAPLVRIFLHHQPTGKPCLTFQRLDAMSYQSIISLKWFALHLWDGIRPSYLSVWFSFLLLSTNKGTHLLEKPACPYGFEANVCESSRITAFEGFLWIVECMSNIWGLLVPVNRYLVSWNKKHFTELMNANMWWLLCEHWNISSLRCFRNNLMLGL